MGNFRRRAARLARTEVALGLVVLTAVCVLLALVAAVVLGFRHSTNLVNRLDREAEQRLVANYVDRLATTSIAQQKVQLTWDDAYKAVVAGRDMRWADTYLGEFLWSNFHYDRIYLVDGQGQLLRAWHDGRPAAVDAGFAPLGAKVRAELGAMADNRTVFGAMAGTQRLQDTDWPVDAQGRALTRWSKAMIRAEGRPAMMTIASIVPDTDMALLRATPSHLVTVRFFDGAMLAAMRSDLLLRDVSVTVPKASGDHINQTALGDSAGDPVGWLNWRFSARGTEISEQMRPLFIALICFVVALVGSGAAILRVLRRTMSKLREREAGAIRQSRRDPMTGLPNRGYFIHRLERTLARIERQDGMALAVAFFDLDHFKYINDTLGHSAGDLLVAEVATRCRSRLRRDDFIARLGGDEFVVMRVGPVGPGEISRLGRELMGIFAAPFKIDGRTIDVTASCGISWAPQQGTSAADLLRNADIALFRAKQRGRSRWRAFTEEMAQDVHLRREIESELRKALQQDQLTLAYQPIVAADDGRIVGCEALLRWDHPELGQISPGLFVPIAEQAGLMNLLGWWTLGRVLQQRAAWPDIEVSINLSPLQLTSRGFLEDLDLLMRELRAKPQGITFEVTEGVLMEQRAGAFEVLAGLRNRGFGVALDDFGTGYSSLSYLAAFRFDRLKIDRAFVQNIDRDLDAQAVLRAIVALGHTLRTRVVAEGVETLLQRQLVVAAGCEMIQGFYHWRPLSPENLAHVLKQQTARGARSARRASRRKERAA